MALADMNIKVGADLSELLTKVDAAKAKLNQLTESNQQLKTGINDLNASLKLNEAELSKNATALKKLVDSGKGATAAANNLRKEIAGLSTNSLELNKNLTAAKTQLAATTVQIKAQAVALKEAEAGTSGFAKGATKLYSGLRTLANIIPGIGIGGLVALISGPLVDAFQDWFESITQVNDATKLLKAQQEDLNDINKETNKDAAKQIVDLQLLYGAATNVNLSMKDRLSAAKALNAEFPETFKNFTAEEIALGKAKSAYDETTLAILRQSRAKAVKGKLDEIATAQLDNDIKRQQLLIETGKKLIEISKRGDILQNVGGGVSVKVTHEQAEAAVNASLKLALQQIDIDNKILEERRKFAASFLDIKTIAPDTGRLKEIDDQIKFLKAEKELHASTLAETKDFNAKIKKLQDERDTIDPPKVKDAKGTTKQIETISDVLKKLAIQIDFLNQKQITLKVNESGAKIAEIEKTIDHLLQKFKLTSESPIIINLKAQINDIQLTEEFNKILKGAGKAQKIDVPLEIQLLMQKPDILFPPGTFDQQILREAIIKKLTDLGINKTIPIKIGLDVTGADIIADSEDIASASINKLIATFADAQAKLKSFQSSVVDLSVSVADSFGAAVASFAQGGNGLASVFQGLLGTLGEFLIKMGEGAVKASALSIALKKIALSPQLGLVAGIAAIVIGNLIKNFKIPGFAGGGEIKGKGTGKSDSILARVSKGEYIIPADKVKLYGVDFFEKIRKGGGPPSFDSFLGGKIPKFASGGFISPSFASNILSGAIGDGQALHITAEFKIRNDHLVAAVNRGTKQINRNS